MEGLNVECVPKVSIAPNSVDILASANDSKTPILVDLPASTKPFDHTEHSCEDLTSLTINNSRINNGDKNYHNQFEEKRIHCRSHTRHSSEDLSSLTVNDLCANKVDNNCHFRIEGRKISRYNSAERNDFKAAEIAERFIQSIDKRVVVDTAAPIESVKDAVSKFGGILDWKERRKHVLVELDKARDDAPKYKRRLEVAEVEKNKVLEELCTTKRTVEGIKISLEKTQIEAMQAQRDLELVEIRFKEMQRGISQKESAIVKAEMELANERREAALTELQSVKMELDQLQKEYTSLVSQRDSTEIKARESIAASQEIKKIVEDLTIKIITMKRLLTSSHAAHIIAEEQKRNLALAYQHEKANWHKELKQIDDEIQKLNDDLLVNKDLESKLQVASTLLINLRDEFNKTYVEVTLPKVPNEAREEEQPVVIVRVMLAQTRKELENMRINIEKAEDEVKTLWNIVAALRANVEKEKTNLVELRQKECLAFVSALSLQEELDKIAFEITVMEERTKVTKMPVELQQASQEAEHAKMKAQLASNEMEKAREEADQAKANANIFQLRLEAASREILAMNASKEIAVASANALQDYKQEIELEPQTGQRRSICSVTLSLDEYNVMIKKIQDAENFAEHQIVKAVEKIKEAREAEVRSLDRLDQLTKQIDDRRIALREAQQKANVAQDDKLTMEDELRKMRAKHEQQQETSQSSNSSPRMHRVFLTKTDTIVTATVTESKPRRSFFPRALVALFMSRRKAHLK
ncbi:hypothetical protein ABZP36_036163 [Zizania latifolia]